ncbi:type II secretion system F family protein [Cytobacillus sp. FJAT-54145]|uniref:Type II secretion system F family protein n=1 Tax=Cytobacillus spartinae TaxID=3299023 RepID=A0ABW6K9Q7_9BACI
MFSFGIPQRLMGVRKMKRHEWLEVVKPAEHRPQDDATTHRFYGMVEPHIEQNRQLYDTVVGALGIDVEKLARKMERGNWKPMKPQELVGLRVAGLVIGILVTILVLVLFRDPLFMLGAGVAVMIAFVYPEIKLKEMITKRQKEIQKNLPDFLDLMVVLLDVGADPQSAILQVSNSFKDATGHEFRKAAIDSQFNGGQFMLALERMAERMDVEDLSELVSAMGIAQEKGTPLSGILREQVKRIRYRQQQDYKERAQKLGTKMLPILLFFILVPLMLILLTPAFLGGVGV